MEIFEATSSHISLISTFGWTPVACAAALATLKIHERDKTWEMAQTKGHFIMQNLQPLLGGPIVRLRGLGMVIGVELKNTGSAKKVIDAAFERGLHIVIGSEQNIQLMPPITIPQELLERGVKILTEVLV